MFWHIGRCLVQYPPTYDTSSLPFGNKIKEEISNDIDLLNDFQLKMMQLVLELYIQKERTYNCDLEQQIENNLRALDKWVVITQQWIHYVVQKYPTFLSRIILFILRPNMSKDLFLSQKTENIMYLYYNYNGKACDEKVPARDVPSVIYNKMMIFAGCTKEKFVPITGYQSPKQLQSAFFSIVKLSICY